MKKCGCGFTYKNKNDLEIVRLEESIKYYCPDCKTYKYTEKTKK